METERLGRSPVGSLVPVTGTDARFGKFAYFAFLPAPLPQDVILTSATWYAVSEATAAISRLNQACLQLPDPRLLIRPALWRESLDTSALEGTDGVLRELLEAQLPSAHFLSPETREVKAFEHMALHAFEMARQRPLSVGFLSDLHAQFFTEAGNAPKDVGRVRRNIVWIGQEGSPIEEARFVPAPPDDRLTAGLNQWETWVQKGGTDLAPVVRMAMAHYQFEALHPFGDGNGRIGRLAIIIQALQAGVLAHPALTVSPWLYRRRTRYQDELLNVSFTGDWNAWVCLFSQALREQCDRLVEVAQRLVSWLTESRRRVQARRWTGTINLVLEDLVEWPVVTMTDTAKKYHVSVVHAMRTIRHLEELGILSELTGGGYRRLYGATDVMEAVESLASESGASEPTQPADRTQTAPQG